MQKPFGVPMKSDNPKTLVLRRSGTPKTVVPLLYYAAVQIRKVLIRRRCGAQFGWLPPPLANPSLNGFNSQHWTASYYLQIQQLQNCTLAISSTQRPALGLFLIPQRQQTRPSCPRTMTVGSPMGDQHRMSARSIFSGLAKISQYDREGFLR